jgi:outer membrane receptor protein involved in Fe transport
MRMRFYLQGFLLLIGLLGFSAIIWGQESGGRIQGSLQDSMHQPIAGATIRLLAGKDSTVLRALQSNTQGEFNLEGIADGSFRLWISVVGFRPFRIDSLLIGTERRSYSLGVITLMPSRSTQLDPVVIVADRSLMQSKDGNLTFLAGDSPLAAGSNASDLLTQVPLVNKDADGKMTVRGKEPKILIDDKPVELNMQQLQDLLESMPGSSIEKIEVMTNPPPQYAQESSVINIVTRKGRVGKTGRLALAAGTRREWSASGQFTYRKNQFSLQLNAGYSQNRYAGDGYSNRTNSYIDSTNQFNTVNVYVNQTNRPSLRAQLDYDWKKNHTINLLMQYNGNEFDNSNTTFFSNINKNGERWRFSQRNIGSVGENKNLSATATYTWRGKPGETLRIIGQWNTSDNSNLREFDQSFLFNNGLPTGQDSTQYQDNLTRVFGWNTRLNYDRMLVAKKTYLSMGFFQNHALNEVDVAARYLKFPEGTLLPLPLLEQAFDFRQTIQQYRGSVKHLFTERFSILIGTTYERTQIRFDLRKEGTRVQNRYGNWLPFATLNRSWKEKYNLTLSYKQTIRRPGLGELNPTVDFSDPYNTRFGNPNLLASTAHNFDLIGGWNKTGRYLNLGVGYNLVKDVYSQVRTLTTEGKTQVTWENISDRREWEVSTWNGFTILKKLKINTSASYTYNLYGSYDRLIRRFQNGGSFTSTLGANYIPNDRQSFSGQFNLNRFATPQGFARWNASLNFGIQRKFLAKRMTVTLNAIDPIRDQRRYTYTYAPNFILENFSQTRTRNYRITGAWSFQPKPKPRVNLPTR